MAKPDYDRVRIAQLTGHSVGCRCCWCGLGEASQDFQRAAETFDRSVPFGGILRPLSRWLDGR